MTADARSLTKPALALLTAGALTLAPAMTAPSVSVPVSAPTVHAANVELAGWFTDTVLYWGDVAASAAIAAVAPIPVIGPPIATQIDINWYDGLRPLAAVTSAYVTSVFVDPLGFFVHTWNYAQNLGFIGYNYVAAQLGTIGIWVPPIPPPPPVASVSPARSAAAGPQRVAPAEAVAVLTADDRADEAVADAPSEAAAVRPNRVTRTARPAVSAAVPTPAAAGATRAVGAPAATDAAPAAERGQDRTTARVSRSAAR